MERFVIGAAVTVAILIAIGGMFGHRDPDGPGFAFVIDGESGGGGPAKGTGAPSTVPAQAFPLTELKVRNAAAVLKIIPEDRADISVEIANPGAIVTPVVSRDGAAVLVDGRIGRRARDCDMTDGRFSATVSGLGELTQDQLPVITVRTPRAVDASIAGAVASEIGPAASAELSFIGCGPARIADVAGKLDVTAAGSGDVVAGAAGSFSLSAAGSGHVQAGAVAGGADISVAGSGDVEIASVAGPLDVSIAGSGDVDIAGGAATGADVSIAGSGSVSLAGDVGALEASIMGSGDVTVRGAAASVDANIMGPGDVRVGAVAGRVQKAVMGPGSVIVGPVPADDE